MKKILSSALVSGFCFYCVGVLTATEVQDVAKRLKKAVFGPKISVVMSTYNRASFLQTSIESILNQTYDDFEFIIIDDGSKDDTAKIVEEYAKKDNRIIFLKNEENKGLVYSLNRGLEKARGEYIARMDDDDKAVPFRFERQVLAMDENKDVIVMGTKFIGSPKSPIPEKVTGKPEVTNPDETEINSYFSSALAHPTIMIRNEFLKKNNIHYSEKYIYAEDCDLYRQILNNGGKMATLKEPLLYLGYLKGSHPEQYGYKQMDSFSRLQKKKMQPFFTTDEKIFGAFTSEINRCTMLKHMVAENPKVKILNQELLVDRYHKNCPKPEDNAYLLKHKDWEGFFVLDADGKSGHRLNADDEKATVTYRSKGVLALNWEKWHSTEYFYKSENSDIYTYTKDPLIGDNYEVEHPFWTATLVIAKDKKIARMDLPKETGKVLNEDKKTISLKWDNWPDVEIFKKQGNKLIYLKDSNGVVKKKER